jgi:hypothetical protein
MIQANELRIGNYVFHQGKPLQITNVLDWCVNMEFGEVSGDRNNEIDINEIDPIPLTEEILLKCGFIIKISDSFSYHFKANVIPTDILYLIKVCFYSDGKFMTVTVGNYDTKIQYLHELQNLIHTLTGEELNIKL